MGSYASTIAPLRLGCLWLEQQTLPCVLLPQELPATVLVPGKPLYGIVSLTLLAARLRRDGRLLSDQVERRQDHSLRELRFGAAIYSCMNGDLSYYQAASA